MLRSAEFLQKAAELREMAISATDEFARGDMLDLADKYERLAFRLEGRNRRLSDSPEKT